LNFIVAINVSLLHKLTAKSNRSFKWEEWTRMAIQITPKKFNKILVGVDDAPDARAAFDYAVDKAKRDGSEIGIVSILESNAINVYQALDKDYIHSTHDQLNERINEYVQAAIDYGVDPKKITAIVDEGSKPAERIVNHVLPQYAADSTGHWFNW
jgi:hypothetical protein